MLRREDPMIALHRFPHSVRQRNSCALPGARTLACAAVLALVVGFVAAGAGPAGAGIPAPATLAPFVPPAAASPAPPGRQAVLPPLEPTVDVITVKGVISPIALDQIADAIGRATEARRAALLVELDTPGGLDASMRSIVQ